MLSAPWGDDPSLLNASVGSFGEGENDISQPKCE